VITGPLGNDGMMGRTIEHPAHAGVEIIAVVQGGRDELRMHTVYKKNGIQYLGSG
jgi:hypothetical protein